MVCYMSAVDVKNLVDPLLTFSKFEHKVVLAGFDIFFNMASVGATASTLLAFNVRTEQQVKAAKMAASLILVNNYTFQVDGSTPLQEKYTFLLGLQDPVFDFFWDAYEAGKSLQYKAFEELHQQGKKSSPTQASEQPGDFSNLPG